MPSADFWRPMIGLVEKKLTKSSIENMDSVK